MQVYRLVTCGTVEEKIYRKQVFKGGLSRSSTEDGVQFRYFSHQARALYFLHERSLHSASLHFTHFWDGRCCSGHGVFYKPLQF